MAYRTPLDTAYGCVWTLSDLAIRKSKIWYTLKKTCVELVRAFRRKPPSIPSFVKDSKLENHPEQHIRGVPRSNSISHFL
ncbi:hypothetical protein Tco_0242519 [Tanacetum coccineum]